MNWYKKANTWESSGYLEEDIEESQNEEELNRALQMNGIDIDSVEEIIFPNNEKVWTIMSGNELYVIEISFPYPGFKKAEEWIWDIVNMDRVWMYVDEKDFSKEFWDGVGEGTIYYHGTNKENLDNILREGISPRNETRGISNRSVGASVFLSQDYYTAKHSYDVILEVYLGSMKRDGYMPKAEQEQDVGDSEMIYTLVDKIGLQNFHYDVEGGMSHDTIILDGGVPPQYIKVI